MKAIVEQDHALTQFLREHHGSLFRTALLLTGDAVDAEELRQDTPVRLFPRRPWVEDADRPAAHVRRPRPHRCPPARRPAPHRPHPAGERAGALAARRSPGPPDTA